MAIYSYSSYAVLNIFLALKELFIDKFRSRGKKNYFSPISARYPYSQSSFRPKDHVSPDTTLVYTALALRSVYCLSKTACQKA